MTEIHTDTAPLPWHGQPYSIKRFGVSISNCADEPVQVPGCIQGHGALLVVHPADLRILQASENTTQLLGHAATALLGKSLAVVVGDAGAAQTADFVARGSLECNPVFLFTHPGQPGGAPLDVTVHGVNGVLIVEFESTERVSDSTVDYFGLLKHSVGRLQNAQSLQELGDIAVREVRTLTGLDRVMVYKFHEDGHGEVVAENRREDLAPWLGMHYPAADIPEPAREIFRRVWIRPVREIGAPLAEMVPLANPETGQPLTMTYCALRGPSVMYTEYLQNMGVSACLTMAIRRGDKLWGLIAAHHYSGPAHIPYDMRAACELLAQVISLQHQAAEDRGHLTYRVQIEEVLQQLVAQAAQEGGLGAMCEGAPNLRDMMDAGGAALFHLDRWWLVGSTPSRAELDALREWLGTRPELLAAGRPVLATDCLPLLYPGGEALAATASGLLAISLSSRNTNVVMWFRPEILSAVHWAGDPDEKPMVTGPHGPRLTPRRSFELFVESVRHHAQPWNSVEIDTALRFRIALMELVVHRAEQLAELNADLARSNEDLDAFAYVASHDLKEPLRGIFKYVHQLSEETAEADAPGRKRLEGLKRLTLRMDSLLDSLLHFSRVGRATLHFDDVDINEVVSEALEMVDARRSEKASTVSIPRILPHAQCDRVRIREVFVNLLSNTLKYNDKEVVQIEVGYVTPSEAPLQADWPQGTEGHLVFYVKDNGIGIQARHFDQLFKMFKRLHGRDEFGGGTGAGLTIVRKLVERHGGMVWLDSTLGAGSTFYFSLLSEKAD